jgi:hypothetical protein
MKSQISILFLALASATLFAETLTDTQGRSIEVDILEVGEDYAHVRRSDGYVFDIPFSKLSRESLDSLSLQKEEPKKEGDDYALLNKILGLKLWNDANLWDDSADQVAQRLSWPKESKTTTQSSYRIYFSGESSIAGTRPYTAVLYGKEGKVDYLSIMFANKGDSVKAGQVDDRADALAAVNDAIEADEAKLRSRFEPLGESQNEIGGISRGMKESALRWDYGNNSFWLAAVDDEYLALRIMPPKLADTWGRPEYRSDAEVRNAAKANVLENEFADVVIKNIPMVNQGPKGYCVPATMERCLRYMGIRADMYTLAMVGNTTIGGGTRLSELLEGLSSYARRSSRKMETISAEVSVRNVKKYINQGQPLMWSMYSTKAYNDQANTITKERMSATAPKEWRTALRKRFRNADPLERDVTRGHLCLIVGYNDTTKEIAVSDSWGPRFELRWIREEEANAVSSGKLYIIDF